MLTRNQSKKIPLYDVDIDFDGASEAWNRNKKRIGNGSYKYVSCNDCKAYTKSGHPCKKKTPFDLCLIHGPR